MRHNYVSISPEIFDYRVNTAPLQFVVASGNQTQCAYVQAISDGIFERVETFRLLLSSENSAVVVDSANSAATIRIFD